MNSKGKEKKGKTLNSAVQLIKIYKRQVFLNDIHLERSEQAVVPQRTGTLFSEKHFHRSGCTGSFLVFRPSDGTGRSSVSPRSSQGESNTIISFLSTNDR